MSCDLQDRAQIHPPGREELPQVHAFDEFHRDVMPGPLTSYFVNRQDVRMIQGGRTARLALEPAQLRLVRREMLRKKLERRFAPELLVAGQIDFAHAADIDQSFNPVASNQFANQFIRAMPNEKLRSDFECGDLNEISGPLVRADPGRTMKDE